MPIALHLVIERTEDKGERDAREESVMTKQVLVSLRCDDRDRDILPSVKPVIESGIKTKLLRIVAMFSPCVRKQDRRRMDENYIPRKSREEESRLEFQRFLYW